MAYTLRLVIPDGSSSILLVEDGSGWALPRVTCDEAEIVIDVGPAIRELTGLDVIVLRDIQVVPPPPPDDAIVCLAERATDAAAARGRWCAEDDVRHVNLTDPLDLVAMQAGSREVRDGPSTALQPWQREGWFTTAVAWIEETLPGVRRVDQFATWCNSCVLRVEAGDGRVYFKASPAYFAHEPAVTVMLAELFPGRVPRTIAIESERSWMLLEDLGDALASGLPVDDRLAALDAIASLHRASVPHVDALIEGGCLDRRPSVLSAQIEAIAADGTVPLPGDLGRRLDSAVPRLQELCVELDSAPIPPTLVHGDLHADNITFTQGRHVIFDWTDACVADPFVDVVLFISRLPVPADSPVRTTFRDRYLEAWSDVVPRSEAVALSELAEPLAAMHQAVTYRGILDAFGEAEWWRFGGALSRWIERALSSPLVGG